MLLYQLLNTIDRAEHITIKDTNILKNLYQGEKINVNGVNYQSEVTAIYTTKGKIIIEVCF